MSALGSGRACSARLSPWLGLYGLGSHYVGPHGCSSTHIVTKSSPKPIPGATEGFPKMANFWKSPTVHFARFQRIQVHGCVLAWHPSLNGLGCDPRDSIGSGVHPGQQSLLCWVLSGWPLLALPSEAILWSSGRKIQWVQGGGSGVTEMRG